MRKGSWYSAITKMSMCRFCWQCLRVRIHHQCHPKYEASRIQIAEISLLPVPKSFCLVKKSCILYVYPDQEALHCFLEINGWCHENHCSSLLKNNLYHACDHQPRQRCFLSFFHPLLAKLN